MALTRSRMLMLIQLWSVGREKGVYTERMERFAAQALCEMGYAEQAPDCPNLFRITRAGIHRLTDPMKLYRSARALLQTVK